MSSGRLDGRRLYDPCMDLAGRIHNPQQLLGSIWNYVRRTATLHIRLGTWRFIIAYIQKCITVTPSVPRRKTARRPIDDGSDVSWTQKNIPQSMRGFSAVSRSRILPQELTYQVSNCSVKVGVLEFREHSP